MMNNFLILSQQKQDDWRQNLEACLFRRGGSCICRTKYLSLLREKARSLKQFPFSVYKGSLLYKGSLFF